MDNDIPAAAQSERTEGLIRPLRAEVRCRTGYITKAVKRRNDLVSESLVDPLVRAFEIGKEIAAA